MRLTPLTLATLVGCIVPPGPRPGDDDDDPLEVVTRDVETDANGQYTLRVEVPKGVTHFQVTGTGDVRGNWIYVEKLVDPNGERVLWWRDWWYSPESLTMAVFGDHVTAFDWPIRDVDGELTPGVWEVSGSMTDADSYYTNRGTMHTSIATKRDDDFTDGTVAVRVVWAEGIDDDAEVVAAVEQAVERWREVWGLAGITLEETYVSSSLDPGLGFGPKGNDPDLEQQSQSKDPHQIQLVVGEAVDGHPLLYGVAGGIPGTIVPSGSTYVVLSWLTHAGRDAKFDADEIRLMGETMAHECGHYTGLFHPVESDYSAWDALDDTPECRSGNNCDDVLGTNVMYPYSICGGGSCLATDELTADQSGVMQRYIGAL